MSYVKTGSIRMYYEQHGEGTPLLLLSGTGWSGEHWNLETVPYFSKFYKVINFDYRGCGRSERPVEAYTTRTFADDAVAMLDALDIDEKVHVLGHSMGGRVAQWIALDHPERVRSLVLAATGPGPIDERTRPAGLTPEEAAELAALGWAEYNAQHLRGANMFYQAAPEVVDRFVNAHAGEFGTDVASSLRHLDARQRHFTTELVANITAETLVIVGAEDNYTSPGHLDTSRYLAQVLPNAEFVVIPNAAHGLYIETAEQFNATVGAFLAWH